MLNVSNPSILLLLSSAVNVNLDDFFFFFFGRRQGFVKHTEAVFL